MISGSHVRDVVQFKVIYLLPESEDDDDAGPAAAVSFWQTLCVGGGEAKL